MKKLTLIVALFVALMLASGCSAPSAPETTPSLNEDEIAQMVFDIIWEPFTAAEQADMCNLFHQAPDFAWQAWNSGAEDTFTRRQFDSLLRAACA